MLLLISCGSQADIRLAVTVDDLPSHLNIPVSETRLEVAQKIIMALKRQGVPEVYGFINAQWLEADPSLIEVLKAWTAAGYPLANHTYSHLSLNKVTAEDFEKNIALDDPILQRLGSGFDTHYFRFPFLDEGETQLKRDEVRQFLARNGYKIAQVTVNFEDWSWNDAYARCKDKNDRKSIAWLKKTYLRNAVENLHRSEAITQKLFHRSVSHIMLTHLGGFGGEMFETMLKAYKKEGVRFIPLSEAVKDPMYSIDPGLTFDSGAEFIYQILKSRGLDESYAGLKPYKNYPGEVLTQICL